MNPIKAIYDMSKIRKAPKKVEKNDSDSDFEGDEIAKLQEKLKKAGCEGATEKREEETTREQMKQFVDSVQMFAKEGSKVVVTDPS